MQDAPKTETTRSRRQQLVAWAMKWLVWRLAGLAFWYYFIALRGQDLEIPHIRWVLLAAFAPVVAYAVKKWWSPLITLPTLPFYWFVGFPLVGIGQSVRFVRRFLRLPTGVLRVVSTPLTCIA